MKILIIPALALAALTGSAMAESRNLQGFSGVGAAGHFNVEVTLGNHYAVDVTGPDAAKITTRIEGRSLHIEGTGFHMFGEPQYNASIHVVMPEIDSLAASRGATVRASGVHADHLSLAAAMGAEIHISGACEDLSASASMGATIDADQLDCSGGDVAASMGAGAHVRLHSSVSAAASMGGDINVSGNPEHRSDHASMGGDVSYN